MKKLFLILVLLLTSFNFAGAISTVQAQTATNPIAVYVDSNNKLRKVYEDGTVDIVLTEDPCVTEVFVNPEGDLYIIFCSPQLFADGRWRKLFYANWE